MPRRKRKKPYDVLPEGSPLRHVFILIEKLRYEPRFAVVSAHSFIELLIATLVRKRCKNGKRIAEDSRTYPQSARLVILHEVGILKDALYQQLDYLRTIRNECVHKPVFELTDAHIEGFASRGFKLVPDDAFEEGRTVWLLWGLIGATWNVDPDVFGREFWDAYVARADNSTP